MCKNLKLIALAIDENFSALFTLKYKFRTNKRQGVVWLSFSLKEHKFRRNRCWGTV